jgi:hypothetical protein
MRYSLDRQVIYNTLQVTKIIQRPYSEVERTYVRGTLVYDFLLEYRKPFLLLTNGVHAAT